MKTTRKAKPLKTNSLLEFRRTILLCLSVAFEYIQHHPESAVEVSLEVDVFLHELEKTWYDNDVSNLERLYQRAETLLVNTVMVGKAYEN